MEPRIPVRPSPRPGPDAPAPVGGGRARGAGARSGRGAAGCPIRARRGGRLAAPGRLFAALAGIALAAGCGGPDEAEIAAHRREVEAWRAERVERLTAEDGWLTVVELAWLEEGDNPAGSQPDAVVVLPADQAPTAVGTFTLRGGAASFRAAPGTNGVEVVAGGAPGPLAPGAELALATDAAGEPTVLGLGGLRFFVIDRAGRLGVRVKDPDSPARRGFAGLDYFPIDPAWRVEARFEPHAEPKTIPVPNIIGTVYDEPSPGVAVFRLDGATHRLDAIGEPADGELFFVFGDETNGTTTYGGGRFLYAPVPDEQGRMVLDFNRAYSPPCAFTAFATCPLPPRGNDLPVAVEAGEKAYHGPGGHA
jgi:hypothetical protein